MANVLLSVHLLEKYYMRGSMDCHDCKPKTHQPLTSQSLENSRGKVSLRELVPKKLGTCHLGVCWVSSVCSSSFPPCPSPLLYASVATSDLPPPLALVMFSQWRAWAGGGGGRRDKWFSLLAHLSAGRQWSGCVLG